VQQGTPFYHLLACFTVLFLPEDNTPESARAAALMEAQMAAVLPLPIPWGLDFRRRAKMGLTSVVVGRGAQASAVAADCRVQAAPDGGKLTDIPPLVRQDLTEILTTADAGTDAARWGGTGEGSSCPLREPDWRPEEGQLELSMVLLDLCCKSDTLSSLPEQSELKMELVHLYEACYASELLTLS
jgi:hypothetical protein